MRYVITISYNGSPFHGWQRQKGLPTVQSAVEDALGRLYGAAVAATGSGRTDEGVHAYGQVAHFDAEREIEPARIMGALNFYLPDAVRVLKCARAADDGFHARKSAKSKTYFYDFYFAAVDDPFLAGRALRLADDIDIEKMKAAAGVFVGAHDFTAFRATGSSAQTTLRAVTECKIEDATLSQNRGLRLIISANGFLYKMARIVAGSLMRVGEGSLSVETLRELLEKGEEWDKKLPAPPHGLYLYKVEY